MKNNSGRGIILKYQGRGREGVKSKIFFRDDPFWGKNH